MQSAGRQAVLPGQRMVGELKGFAAMDDLLVKPVPARPGQLKINQKIKNDAFIHRFFEPGVEIDVEVGGERIAFFVAL